ncbi:MAG: FKBP-type peptidyl-prolyl cis-trans isomerase [Thermodesulfobacteriota bacterium]|nr:FKBP-type peptidyl-prolyl cis-trans isomerase [Thermodesulfobacteriota bacterium]
MKPLIRAIVCAGLLALVAGCQNQGQQSASPAEPTTDKEKVSYIIGANMARSIANISDEIDVAMMQKGMEDQIKGQDLLVSDEEARPLLQAFSEKIRAKQQEQMAAAGQKNLEEGQAFLEENKGKEGVKTTESGLQYKILEKGQGQSPDKTDKVKVHYKGTTIDGTVFDSSYDRGEPAVFAADKVIKGWTEGIQLMKEGGKYKLFIPAELAYGQQGAGQNIGPNEVLIFEVELLEVLNEQQKDEKDQSAG